MKLKTLKDLKFKNSFATERDMVNVGELKAEAVKWVKFQESKLIKDKEGNLLGNTSENYGVIIFIKHFFNITEEDLK